MASKCGTNPSARLRTQVLRKTLKKEGVLLVEDY